MIIEVWTKSNCVQCEQTKKRMDQLGIRYEVKDLELNPLKLDEFKNKGFLQAPIVVTDTKIWAGFRPDKIQSLANYLMAHPEKPEVIDKPCEVCGVVEWQMGRNYEQERIIKLVERFGFDEELGFTFEQAKEDLITLIKGEN